MTTETIGQTIFSPAIQNMIVLLTGGIFTGITTLVTMVFLQRNDVKKLLIICSVFSKNINTLNPCLKKIIKATRSHNYAFKEVIKEDDESALQSVASAKIDIEEAEDFLNKRYDENSEAAMSVSGGR